MAQWIRHPPTKREIAGSSPVGDYLFCILSVTILLFESILSFTILLFESVVTHDVSTLEQSTFIHDISLKPSLGYTEIKTASGVKGQPYRIHATLWSYLFDRPKQRAVHPYYLRWIQYSRYYSF